MKRFWILVPLSVLLVPLILTATPVSADGGQTAFGNPVTIRSGQTVDGDLVSLGGPVTVERGATVEGNVVSMGGPVSVAGRVEGDVVSFGGPVSLGSSAVIAGDVVSAGGPIRKHEGAVVRGEIIEGFRFGDMHYLPFRLRLPSLVGSAVQVEMGSSSGFLSFIFGLFRVGFRAAGVAVIALLLLIFVPQQTNTVKQMTADQPIASFGVGVLTLVVATLVLGVLIITICGIPIALILGLALLMALLYGWIALGIMVGERILTALDTERPLPLIAGVLGALLITLLSSVPCLGALLGFVGASWGLGAVVLSRGGTQSYPSLPGGWSPAPTRPRPPTPGVVEPATVPEEAPPAPKSPAAPPVPPVRTRVQPLDDLQAIRGIGPVYEGLLREAGIRTYGDLVSRTPEELADAVSGPSVIPVSVEAAEGWIEEARRLMEIQS